MPEPAARQTLDHRIDGPVEPVPESAGLLRLPPAGPALVAAPPLEAPTQDLWARAWDHVENLYQRQVLLTAIGLLLLGAVGAWSLPRSWSDPGPGRAATTPPAEIDGLTNAENDSTARSRLSSVDPAGPTSASTPSQGNRVPIGEAPSETSASTSTTVDGPPPTEVPGSTPPADQTDTSATVGPAPTAPPPTTVPAPTTAPTTTVPPTPETTPTPTTRPTTTRPPTTKPTSTTTKPTTTTTKPTTTTTKPTTTTTTTTTQLPTSQSTANTSPTPSAITP